MSLESVKDILAFGSANDYCVPAFNVYNYESIRWVTLAAENEKSPVIIAFYPGYSSHISMEQIAEIASNAASKVKVPIGLHLDHATSFDMIMAGVSCGFQSVMIDGSALPFDENAKLTLDVIKAVKKRNITVEAEIGCVGSASAMQGAENESRLTDPLDAKRFIDLTDADSLAIAVGNAHGNYQHMPILDFDRIQAIKSMTNVPLVLHGGSGLSLDQLHKAMYLGICKLNIATDYDQQIYEAIMTNEQSLRSFFQRLQFAQSSVVEYLQKKIRGCHFAATSRECEQDAQKPKA